LLPGHGTGMDPADPQPGGAGRGVRPRLHALARPRVPAVRVRLRLVRVRGDQLLPDPDRSRLGHLPQPRPTSSFPRQAATFPPSGVGSPSRWQESCTMSLPPGTEWGPGRGTPAHVVPASGPIKPHGKGGPMHLLHRAAATAALLLPLAVAPVTAQDYRGALGIYGGGVWFSDFNNDGDIDLNNRFFNGNNNFFNGFPLGRADLKLDAGWIVGAQGDLYFGNGRLGARLNFGYTERPIDVDGIILTVFDENDDFF